MAGTLDSLLRDLERSGPEALGAPLRAVAVLARDVAQVLVAADDPLARHRRRASAARAARSALSFAAGVDGALGDRPDLGRAWRRELRALRSGAGEPARGDAGDGCARALLRVAGLALLLPTLHQDEEWQAGAIAFADEGTLEELHDACVELAVAAARTAVVS